MIVLLLMFGGVLAYFGIHVGVLLGAKKPPKWHPKIDVKIDIEKSRSRGGPVISETSGPVARRVPPLWSGEPLHPAFPPGRLPDFSSFYVTFSSSFLGLVL